MKARELLAEGRTPDGEAITLTRESEAFMVRIDGYPLMSSRVHGSEEAMADFACAPLRNKPRARVLIGGLGLGYTLRAALDGLARDAELVVSELLPPIVEWNRGVLGPLAGHPLTDRRVKLVEGDLRLLVRKERPESFDALLLDVDNGPEAFTVASNDWLYGPAGLDALARLLRPGGVLVVWSALESPRFARALRTAGLAPELIPVRSRGAIHKGSHHFLHVGRRPPVSRTGGRKTGAHKPALSKGRGTAR